MEEETANGRCRNFNGEPCNGEIVRATNDSYVKEMKMNRSKLPEYEI
jgi:hypothetical protein